MAKFVAKEFTPGEFACYRGKFVARFKRGGRANFLAFLCKNFEVEEYFARLDAGETPLKILESKGYLLPHIRKMLTNVGLPATPAGLRMLIDRQVACRI